jgi:DNA-directed RNA polymerase
MTYSVTDSIINEIDNNQEWNLKVTRQAELEDKMRGMGVDRFWSNVANAREREQETSVRSVRRLMNHAITKITVGVQQFLDEAGSGRAGPKHTAVKFLKQIEPEVAATVTARVVLDSIAKESAVIPTSRRIGQMIEDELAFRQFEKADPQVFKWLVKREKSVNGTEYRRQRITMYHNMKSREIEWKEWSIQEQALVGGKLLDIMVETTGLVSIETRSVETKRYESYVVATPETMEWINEENNRCEALAPVYLPTIIPPRPWTSPFEGGYWTPRVRRLNVIKTYSREYLEELAEHEMPDLYDALNIMQHTAWCINQPVLEVLRNLWNHGSTLGGIPSADDLPLPPKPHFLETGLPSEEWTDEHREAFKQWKRAATDVYAANAKLKSLRLQFAKVLMVAEMFEHEEEIYFPHQLDFRGRAYAVPMFLNPQGSDVSKGLLTFANGVAINDEDARSWLAIHGSNCFGYDKASLEDRVRWVEEHEEQIIACAEDPYNVKLWADADSPFQFLAFCFEWTEFKREGWGYISTLPIQMDGSCNGLQNFSAMLRDPIGGEAVNLVPTELPADIYQKVADRVLLRVEEDAAGDDEEKAALAQGWLKHGVNRKVCKRPVMTLAYGAKAFGFKTQVFEDTVLPYKFEVGQENFPWEGTGWKAASYMGSLIWDCVGEVVVAARQAMDWLQKAARAASKEGLPVRWETPDGLVVLQAYPKMLTKRIKLTFGGVNHRLTLATNVSAELDNSKQANGISPNWVHSMDASHMRATVRRCWAEGIRSFSLIHDSYGTHAGNAWALAQFLREEFIEMYQEDVMQRFKEDLELQLPEGTELDPLPPKGSLDLAQVLESRYFFA